MMWSTTGLNGSGAFNLLSIGLPHIPQVFCVFKRIFLFLSKATRCAPVRSARNTMGGHLTFATQKANRIDPLALFVLFDDTIIQHLSCQFSPKR